MIQREREIGEIETVCLKRLELVPPIYARSLGLVVDRPVFISPTDSIESRTFVYQVGATVKVSYFDVNDDESFVTSKKLGEFGNPPVPALVVYSRPKYGMGYDEMPKRVIEGGCTYWGSMTHSNYWVAIIEPTGRVLEHEDYLIEFNRITDELVVRKILVHCKGCPDMPLREGLVVQVGDRRLFACCDSGIHDKEIAENPILTPRFKFQITETDELVFNSI